MKRFIMVCLGAVIFLAACGQNTNGDLEVHNAWTRPTAKGENAAVYLTLHNHSQNAEILVGVTSNMTDTVEIHESKMENDIMQMSMLKSLAIPSGDVIVFEPGSLHIMLVGIKQEFKLGEHIAVVLHFENHEDVVVNVRIEVSQPDDEHENSHDE